MKVTIYLFISFLTIASSNFILKRSETNHINIVMSGCDNEDCDNMYKFAHNESLAVVTSFPFNSSVMTTPLTDLQLDFINDTSFWAVFDEKYLRHSWGWTVTFIVAYTLILIIGIIGNLMVILVVVKRRQMRNVTNMFIMNLAVADLFVIVFCVPVTLLSNVLTPWILGSVMCKSVAYVQGVSVCASAYSLAAISVDRCRAIYRALGRPRGFSKRQALIVTFLIWVIALLLTIPWAVTFDVVFFEKDGISYCVETWENETYGKIYFLVANLFCCYCLPLILISISNVIIWCHVKQRKVPQDSASAASIRKMHRKTRHGVRRMLGIVNLAFLLSWLPLYILVTKMKFMNNVSDGESSLMNILLPLAQLLGSLNSSINPILYAFLNRKFREMFKSLLPLWIPFVNKKGRNITVRCSMGQQTITNGYMTTGSGATYTYTDTQIADKRSRSKSSAGSGDKDELQNSTSVKARKSFFMKSMFGGTPETLVIIVTSPTSSSLSSVNV